VRSSSSVSRVRAALVPWRAAIADEVRLTGRRIPASGTGSILPSLGGAPLSPQLERVPCDTDLTEGERRQVVSMSAAADAQLLQLVFGLTEQRFDNRGIGSLDDFQLEHAGSLVGPERCSAIGLSRKTWSSGASSAAAMRVASSNRIDCLPLSMRWICC
jgi:hypothetical protein